jgi:hypothetical protein
MRWVWRVVENRWEMKIAIQAVDFNLPRTLTGLANTHLLSGGFVNVCEYGLAGRGGPDSGPSPKSGQLVKCAACVLNSPHFGALDDDFRDRLANSGTPTPPWHSLDDTPWRPGE